MLQVEQGSLGLWRVREMLDEPHYKQDGAYYRQQILPGKFKSELFKVDTQTNDYNCSVSVTVAAGRLQNLTLCPEQVERQLGVTVNGIDPDQMHRRMTRLGIISTLWENMRVPQLVDLLRGGRYCVIIDYQEPECSLEEKLTGDAGHYAMAYTVDSNGFLLLGEPAYADSSRIHLSELEAHWYDVSLRTGKWFFGVGIVIPYWYQRKWR